MGVEGAVGGAEGGGDGDFGDEDATARESMPPLRIAVAVGEDEMDVREEFAILGG